MAAVPATAPDPSEGQVPEQPGPLQPGEAAALDARYPPGVLSAQQRRRFDLALGVASNMFEEPEDSASVRMAALAIYRDSSIPTGDDSTVAPQNGVEGSFSQPEVPANTSVTPDLTPSP